MTITPKDIQRRWYVVDATDKTLGRFATEIARRLRGKHKPEYTSNMDLGDYIIVINAGNIKVTGGKKEKKIYRHYTGYIGGMKTINFEKLLMKKPERIIEHAIKGMLPKGPLGRAMLKKLKIYAGAVHNHVAQQPEFLDI